MAVFFILLIYKNYKTRVKRDKEILEAVFKTQDEERNRIAVDLHDEIGLGLNAIRLHNSALIEDTDKDTLVENIKESISMTETLTLKIREIVRAQSTTYVYANGLPVEILNLYGRVCEKQGILFNHEINLNGILLNKEFQLNHFRICQELLHNALKHAGCSIITIKLVVELNMLTFKYTDNGKGTEIYNSGIKGIGIQNIKSRAERYQGICKFTSSSGNGFICEITYPIARIKEKL